MLVVLVALVILTSHDVIFPNLVETRKTIADQHTFENNQSFLSAAYMIPVTLCP
jgi:hypothetical protein